MVIPQLYSIKEIEKQYDTGELPVLVTCSDMNAYICKYMRSSSAAYKLVSELVGALFAKAWKIASPPCAFVQIKTEHWAAIQTPRNLSAPCWGYQELKGSMDITPTTYSKIELRKEPLLQLLKIALFDFWIANEDRTCNNANLLYDVINQQLISIDYGGILNTSILTSSLSQLSPTDTILYADIFHHLKKCSTNRQIEKEAARLKDYYYTCVTKSHKCVDYILQVIPEEWNVRTSFVESKLHQLFDQEWLNEVWFNFKDCLKENLKDG